MDEADNEEREEKKLSAEELQRKIDEMKRLRDEAKELEKKLGESGQSQISLTDSDSRMTSSRCSCGMPVSGDRRTDECYNVQVCVDEKHKLISDHEVTNAITDRDPLSYMAKRVKELLGVEDLEVVADMGYYHGKEVKACVEAGITPLIPKPRTSARRKYGLFSKEDSTYDLE